VLQVSNRFNTTHPLVMLDQRITDFTTLTIGKFAHKRYDNTGNGELLNNLHHDANGACCGLEKRSLARVATLLLYMANDGLAGGHTIFPAIGEDVRGVTAPDAPAHARAISPAMWSKLLDTYYKAPNGEHVPDQYGHFNNKTLGGMSGQACRTIAHDDARGRVSSVFGVRPHAGDAVLFYMKVPAP
jgi:hypothetical protein